MKRPTASAVGGRAAGATPVAHPPARLPPGVRVYAIGDIHGRDDLLAVVHARIAADAARADCRQRIVVHLGDCVSRGADSRGVVERIRRWRPPGFEIVALKGNHEEMLLRFVDGDLASGDRWFDQGGLDALASYGVGLPSQARDAVTLEDLRRQFAAALPPEHRAFFAGLKAHHSVGDYRFVHAGVAPGVALAEQTDHDQMWVRQAFLESELDHGAVVVHGHCISERPELRHNRIGIDTGAYRTNVLTCLVLDGATRAIL